MHDPVLIEVTRGPAVESRHGGAVAVVDADGAVLLTIGEVERPVFPRSAVKPLQALPLVESGAADAYGLSDPQLALACASHNGEAAHVEAARAMLARAGRSEADLECGIQWPARDDDRAVLVRQGKPPGAIHNNCSGKHSGFICLACHIGTEPAGYVRPDHPAMREVHAVLEETTGERLDEHVRGIDGCSVPTWAVPLPSLARAFARFGSGVHWGAARAAAAARLRQAMTTHAFMVAGTGRFCTLAMEALGSRAAIKTGAEGVFCAALPERGLGIALKVSDGATRAAEVMMATLLARLLPLSGMEEQALEPLLRPKILTRNGVVAGAVRPTKAFEEALAGLSSG